MRQTRPTGPITRPTTGIVNPPPPPMPLEAQQFRPRGALAATLLVGPTVVLLALIALFRISHFTGEMAHVAAAACAALSALWIAESLLVARLVLTTVHVTTDGIETRTPWDGRKLLRWRLIDQVERRRGILRLHSSDGQHVTFVELGLTNSRQLLRHVLLRVSPTVLSAPLQQELAMLGGPSDPNAEWLVPVAPQWLFL